MSTAAPVFVVRIPQHSDYRRTIRLRNATTGEYLDLTDYLVEMQIRETAQSAVAILSLSSAAPTADGQITVVGDAAEIVIPFERTATLDFDLAAYDIRFTSYDEVVNRVLQGPAYLDRGVTR